MDAKQEIPANLNEGREYTPVDLETVRAAVKSILERADSTLAQGESACNDAGALELEHLAGDIAQLYRNIAHANTARALLYKAFCSVTHRGAAISEVREKGAWEIPGNGLCTTAEILELEEIPARWRVQDDDDLPF